MNKSRLYEVAIVLFFANSIFYSRLSIAKSISCADLPTVLQDMKKAQQSIHQSLIGNHEMMAQSLDSYTDALVQTGGKAHKTVSENMKKASTSLRDRADKAQVIALKLNENTEEVLKTVEKCLK